MKANSLVFLSAFLLRFVLLFYGEWQDGNMEVKYTDVDYWVFTDAACAVAEGMSPFSRSTYRYTPLLAWILLPNCWIGKFWGKLLFCLTDLISGYFIYKILLDQYQLKEGRAIRITAYTWLFNPMIFTISTRGNVESFLCCLILGTIYFILKGRFLMSGIIFGLAVHLKLFPAIYSFSFLHFIWNESWNKRVEIPSEKMPFESNSSIASRSRSKSNPKLICHSAGSLRFRNFNNVFRKFWNLVRFGVYSLSSFLLATIPMLWIYKGDYMNEGFMYHLTRKDHRHNFSPYFLPFYLESVQALPSGTNLAAFLPQLLLLMVIGFKFGRKHLPFACFLQTFVFVTFNKVCTSQYFLWYLCLLPFVYVSMDHVKFEKWLFMAVAWFGAQGIWLKLAYDLEFAGKNSYIPLWIASILFMLVNTLLAHHLIVNFINKT